MVMGLGGALAPRRQTTDRLEGRADHIDSSGVNKHVEGELSPQ